MRINLRLNPNSHKDIIKALSNSKNVSEEVRRLLQFAIDIKNNPQSIEYTHTPQINKLNINEQNDKKEKKVDEDKVKEIENNLLNIDFDI